MRDTLTSAPARHEVRAALLWALEHDREALLEHRETTQHRAWEAERGLADRRIVGHWREATDPLVAPLA